MLTLRTRLVLVNVLVFLLTFVVLAGVLAGQLIFHLYEQFDRELVRVSAPAIEHVRLVNGALTLRDPDGRLVAELGEGGFVRVLDAQGKVVEGLGNDQALPVARQALTPARNGVVGNQRTASGEIVRVYTRPILAPFEAKPVAIGYLQVAKVPEEVLEIIAQIQRSLLIAMPLALLVVGAAVLWAARKALQPLTDMTRSAAAISADSLADRRLPIPRARDEIQELALAFNATLDRLAAAFARQRRFTADASHELRTPITAILGQAELALNRPRSPEVYQESLRRIEDEAQRMQRLVSRMLTLARAESGRQILEFVPTDAVALLRTLTETLATRQEGSAVTFALDTPPAAIIITDADCLTQILLNLLDNAVAYAERGAIEVALAEAENGLRIQVSDSGPGIDPASLPHIFDPFFRADPSRQRQSGGVGLGLALAHELTVLLGGTLEAANRPAGGAQFTLHLPLQPPQPPQPPTATHQL